MYNSTCSGSCLFSYIIETNQNCRYIRDDGDLSFNLFTRKSIYPMSMHMNNDMIWREHLG